MEEQLDTYNGISVTIANPKNRITYYGNNEKENYDRVADILGRQDISIWADNPISARDIRILAARKLLEKKLEVIGLR